MSATRRKAVVATLAVAYLLLLAFGGSLLGPSAPVVMMVGVFVVGFAWLWLLVAPWATEGRRGRREP